MSGLQHFCSVCSAAFEPRFSYQMEERVEQDETGRPHARFLYFCSHGCLERSHGSQSDAQGTCDACAATFRVEFASQVLYVAGKRKYACSNDCRHQLQQEARGRRLGDALDTPQRPTSIVTAPVIEEAALSEAADEVAAALPAEQQAPLPSTSFAEDASVAQVRPLRGPAAPSDRKGPQVIAVFNHKGGTGKTTTAVTVAAGLATAGKRVLLVDTDGQGNVAVSLNLESERSLYHVLVMGLSLKQAVVQARPNLWVLPSNETMAAAELYLAGRKQRDRILAERLGSAREHFDHIIVDCSPSLSLLNQNALTFADAVLCPVACDYLSLVGIRQVMRTLKQVQRHLRHPVELWGVLPTMFDARANICHEALATLREHFGDRCLAPVRASTKAKEAPAQGLTLFEHAPGAPATLDYQAVVERLILGTPSVAAPSHLAAAAGELA